VRIRLGKAQYFTRGTRIFHGNFEKNNFKEHTSILWLMSRNHIVSYERNVNTAR
jgi:hypothetical protein